MALFPHHQAQRDRPTHARTLPPPSHPHADTDTHPTHTHRGPAAASQPGAGAAPTSRPWTPSSPRRPGWPSAVGCAGRREGGAFPAPLRPDGTDGEGLARTADQASATGPVVVEGQDAPKRCCGNVSTDVHPPQWLTYLPPPRLKTVSRYQHLMTVIPPPPCLRTEEKLVRSGGGVLRQRESPNQGGKKTGTLCQSGRNSFTLGAMFNSKREHAKVNYISPNQSQRFPQD